MALRVCMVTPFAWSQPHPVNEHVAGAAGELRRRGHEVVVLAPSNRAADLAAGRRALRRLAPVIPADTTCVRIGDDERCGGRANRRWAVNHGISRLE